MLLFRTDSKALCIIIIIRAFNSIICNHSTNKTINLYKITNKEDKISSLKIKITTLFKTRLKSNINRTTNNKISKLLINIKIFHLKIIIIIHV